MPGYHSRICKETRTKIGLRGTEVANLKKYDLDGKEIGSVDIDESLMQQKANSQMIKDYLVAIRNKFFCSREFDLSKTLKRNIRSC